MERERIEWAVGYIETHLCEELDVKTLARLSGYSEFHFIRMFRRHGRPYAGRLCAAAAAVGGRASSRSAGTSAVGRRVCARLQFEGKFQPRLQKNACRLSGRMAGGQLQFADAGAVFVRYLRAAAGRFGSDVRRLFPDRLSVCRRAAALLEPIQHRKALGPSVRRRCGGGFRRDAVGRGTRAAGLLYRRPAGDAKGDRTGTVRLEIRGGKYAVFETQPAAPQDFVGVIRRTWDWIYGVWLPRSGYRRADGYELESYIESSRTYTERIYVPIERE